MQKKKSTFQKETFGFFEYKYYAKQQKRVKLEILKAFFCTTNPLDPNIERCRSKEYFRVQTSQL